MGSTIETRPHFRVGANWYSDVDLKSIDPLHRALAAYVHFGLIGISREREAFGLVDKAFKAVRAIVDGIQCDPRHIIDVLVEAEIIEYNKDADMLRLLQWDDWQQTEDEVANSKKRRSAAGKAGAKARWDRDRARKAAETGSQEASSTIPHANRMRVASESDAIGCDRMAEENRTGTEREEEAEPARTPVQLVTARTTVAPVGDDLVLALIEQERAKASRNLSVRDLHLVTTAVAEALTTHDRQRVGDALAEAFMDGVTYPATIFKRAVGRGPSRPAKPAPKALPGMSARFSRIG